MCRPRPPAIEVQKALPAAPVAPVSAIAVDQSGPKLAEQLAPEKRNRLRINRTASRPRGAGPSLNIPR